MKATDRISDEMLEALIDIEKVFIGKYEDRYKESCDIDIAIVTALEELQSYRFTEITPEQIIEMDKEYRKKCEEVEELRKLLIKRKGALIE